MTDDRNEQESASEHSAEDRRADSAEQPSTRPPDAEPSATEEATPPGANGERSNNFLLQVRSESGKAVRALGCWTWAFLLWLGRAAKNSNPRFAVEAQEKLLDGARAWFPPGTVLSFFGAAAKLGHGSLAVAQILAPLLFLAAAIRLSSGALLLHGIGWTLLLMALHYAADRFLDAGPALVESSPTALASRAFLNSMALLAEVAGILLFFAIVIHAGRLQQWNVALIGLVALALGDAAFFLILHPSLLAIRISEDSSAGKEAIGMLSFFAKLFVRMIPVAFGIGTLVGTVGLFLGTIAVLFSSAAALRHPMPGLVPLVMIACFAALPLVGYFLMAFFHLLLDVLQTLLGLRSGSQPKQNQR